MADSYANEWARINSIASQIDSLQQEVDRLEIRYHEISTQLNYLPVDLDEDGYDRNEGQRRMLESQLSMIQDSISQARTNIVIRQDAARSLSAGFMAKARSYREESSKAANVGNEFKRLEGFRFGSSTAAAGGKLADQRSTHYNDHATALEGLAAAADRAAMGVSTAGGTGTIADRGSFENPQSRSAGNYNKSSGNKADISFGAGSVASGNSATNGRREITGAMKNRINEDLGAPSGTQKSGSSSSQNSAELEKYAAGAVSTNLTGGEMVDYADSTFAKQYGMSSEEFKQYRQENHYSYVADSGMAHLVHDGISEAGGWTSEPEARGEVGRNESGSEADFIGKLRGEDIILKNVKTKTIKYVKRGQEEREELRNAFDSTERKNFLIKLSDNEQLLKNVGLSEIDILDMRDGFVPEGWQVHHKLPLDDSGDNSFENLVLIKNEPYHKVITNYQNSIVKGLKEGDIKIIEFPIPEGSIYPLKNI